MVEQTLKSDRGDDQPVFLYDDGCPLCKSYTATFTALGWTGREAFSEIDAAMFDAIDFDRARNKIPLVDRRSGEVRYGLDGILGVVAANAPVLAPLVEHRAVRRGLEGVYWFITYNRRHIVTAAPPTEGVDCAPDFNRASVASYIGFCAVGGATLAARSGAAPAIAAVTTAAATVVANRRSEWAINRWQGAGHVGSVTVASGAMAAVAGRLTGSPRAAAAAALVTGARKVWLRRWLLAERGGAGQQVKRIEPGPGSTPSTTDTPSTRSNGTGPAR